MISEMCSSEGQRMREGSGGNTRGKTHEGRFRGETREARLRITKFYLLLHDIC